MRTFCKNKIEQGGYVALMATIIISAVLLVMSVEGGIAGWHARFNVLGTEAKEQASALAQGCADQALSAIMTDPSYIGDIVVTTEVGTCTVFPIEFNIPAEGIVTIRTQAVVHDSYANLEMQMDMSEIHIDSIPEAPTKGTLVVITNVVNDGSGTLNPGDFTMHVVGGSPSQSSFSGSDSGVVVTVEPGTYAITGDSISGYSTTVSTNCSGTIDPGELKFCTVTNDDIKTTLTVLINVVNDDGGILEYTDFPLLIDGNPATPGTAYTVTPGSHTASASLVSGYAFSAWGYQCASGGSVTVNEGQNKTCIINVNDNAPPTPSCADTVMMLDRSGSMSSFDLSNERTAANSLTDLYAGVLPPANPPHLSVGSIGGLDGSSASIPLLGQLSTLYTNIKSAITSITGSNSSVGTNLASGITTANTELNGPRHVFGNEKVLILVSDGDPNQPTGSMTIDTGYKSPEASVQDGASSAWTTPTNAYGDGAGDASAIVTGSSNRERYYNFNFGSGFGLPSNATINGIQAKVDSWTTASLVDTPASSIKSPTTSLAPNQWTNPTRASQSDNSYTTSATNTHEQGLAGFGFSIPSNATITGIEIATEAKAEASPTTFFTESFGAGNPTDIPNWDENGSDTVVLSAGSGNDSVSPSGGSFARIDDNGGWICRTINASGLSNLAISYNWRGDSDAENNNPWGSDDGPDLGMVEYNTSGSANCNNSSGWNTIESHDLSIDSSWSTFTETLPSVLNNDNSWTLRFRNPSINGWGGNSEHFRIDDIQLTANSILPTSALAVALSSNNGSSYTTEKSVPLTTTESVAQPTGNSTTDLWGRTWTPTDFNNGNFAVHIKNSAPTGVTISLDQLTVEVNYTIPNPSGTSCQLGVALSWNGGTSWSSEKTQSLNSTETTYTLGATNDDWRSGSWAPTDFTNTNFRARVRAIDPGSSCSDTATEHLDWLQFNVTYTQPTDPIEAALSAADSAKLSGTNIFTIHFGADPSGYQGREFLANLASGDIAVSAHEDGSYADPGGVTSGNTGNISPTAQSATSGGDGNGFEANPGNAFADGPSGVIGAAGNMNGAGDRHLYSGYGITVPPGATIVGIATRLDWWLESTNGNNSIGVELSWNGGTSWTSAKTATNESTNSSNSATLGGSSDTWSRSWTADDFEATNFRVRTTSNCSSSTSCNSRDFYLDWIPVTVYYTVNAENGDDDNFFISPTSADMRDIFDYIGEQVCPAIGFAETSEPPTTGLLTVITQVINNNGGALMPDEVNISATPSSASPNSFAGSSSGVVVVLDPGGYTISGDTPEGYVEIAGAGCSSSDAGVIAVGEARVCVLTYDDIPPPPPPPNLTIHLGSWKEVPVAE